MRKGVVLHVEDDADSRESVAAALELSGFEVHPADFFKTPTVADLATLIEIRLIEQIELAAPSVPAAAAALS